MLDAVATTGNGMTLPSLKTPLASPTNVYESKNKDRHPHIRAVSVLPPLFFFFWLFLEPTVLFVCFFCHCAAVLNLLLTVFIDLF